jgi:hypothetical protein
MRIYNKYIHEYVYIETYIYPYIGSLEGVIRRWDLSGEKKKKETEIITTVHNLCICILIFIHIHIYICKHIHEYMHMFLCIYNHKYLIINIRI